MQTKHKSADDSLKRAVAVAAHHQSMYNRSYYSDSEIARVPGKQFTSPDEVKRYLIMANAQGADQFRERFGVLFLDSHHALIEFQVMFTGTLTATSVYPREVVRAALAINASAVILTHNHPSGDVTPSNADTELTNTLKKALGLVDVRVLDHVITCSGARTLSMAEQGLV